MHIRSYSFSFILLILSYLIAILSSVFALLALRPGGLAHYSSDEMLTFFFVLSVPNFPSLAMATLSLNRSRRSSALWLVASLVVATPICAMWLHLLNFPEKRVTGPVPSFVPGGEVLIFILHLALASFAFVFATICDLGMSIRVNRDSTMTQRKSGFTLISKDAYVDRFLKANPSERRDNVVARLDDAIAAHKEGKRCSCGEQIWIVGSAEAGYGCFTCITGEATPDSNYEISTT